MMMKSGEGAVRLCQMDPQVSVPAANQQQGQTVAPFQMILRWVMAGDELTGHPGHQLEGPEDPDGPQRLEVHALLLGLSPGPSLAPGRRDDRDEPEE